MEEVRRRGGAAIVQALGTGEHEGLGWIALEYLGALEREGWMTGNARAVALTALKQLTGLDRGDDLAAWRRALGVERPGGE